MKIILYFSNFVGQLRTKAISILTAHNIGSSGLSSFTTGSSVVASTENHHDSELGSSSSSSSSVSSDQFQSSPQRQQQQQQTNGGNGSPEDERVRKTVRLMFKNLLLFWSLPTCTTIKLFYTTVHLTYR